MAGAAIGGLALLAAAIGVWLYRRRKARVSALQYSGVGQIHSENLQRTPTMTQFTQLDAPLASRTKDAEANAANIPSSANLSSNALPLSVEASATAWASASRPPEGGANVAPSQEAVEQQRQEIERLRAELEEARAMQEAPPPYLG